MSRTDTLRTSPLRGSTQRLLIRWVALKALDILRSESGAQFATVRGEGYRRLGSADGVDYAGMRSLLTIRRASKRGGKRVRELLRHANDLTAGDRRKANSRLCAFGLIEHLTKAATIETLPAENAPPPPAKIDALAQLRGALGL